MLKIFFLLSLLGFALNIIIIKSKFFFEKLNKDYNPIQKIHTGFVPRIGGLILISCFYIGLILSDELSVFLELNLLIAAFMIILAGSIEDLFGIASPIYRLISIFAASFTFMYFQKDLPIIDIPILENFFNSHNLFTILFYSIGLTALSNGFNMIDGMNGLVGFTGLGCLISLLTLTNFIIDVDFLQKEILYLTLLIIIFLIFNFPNGKIFFGDTGAYWLGWILGIMIIKLYSYYDLNTWGAIIILFYPLQEVIFSFFRKLLQKKSPLSPDIEHLHLKLYFLLKGTHERGKKFNSFVTVCMMPFWLLPCLMIIWSQLYSHIMILFFFILEFAYLYYFFAIPKISKL